MELCKRCNSEPSYEDFECCENCMNAMLLGGPEFKFIPDNNFYKEIGCIETTEPHSDSGGRIRSNKRRWTRVKLQNGRIEVGPDIKDVLQRELDELNAKLAILLPKVDKDIEESRKRHRELWNY